ncbi:MAG TPA: DUF86 domain-containing protein [Candidatus Diapherotrites archaeon]|uniref:DUF86 domain-containing protein n=1 Tax=Candidatus Iainarchaeum sp. TaxID=3101447 RepID=A0A7J4KWF9_9ARCH|nr:DUF86 domain-containing protein [Candidatus Diapherotrites archaeon]
MTRDESLYISEILEQIELIQASVKGRQKTDFGKDLNLRDATIRRIEVIGEAAKSISEKTKAKHPKVSWKEISGTRDVLIHAYFGVDLNILWNIIKADLPLLKQQMKKIKEEQERL